MKTINRSAPIEVKRSEINFADYNPRRITEEARRTLRKGLKTFGLVGGIVVNRKPGNGEYTLVSGHQRLTEMDAIQGYPKNDYLVRVEAVELSDKQERELNILLNNPSAQGEWDYDRLAEIIPDIDYTVAGLTDADLAFLQPQSLDGVEAPGFDDLDSFHIKVERENDPKRYESEKQRLAEEKRKTAEKAQTAARDLQAYLCLSFSNHQHKTEFCQRFGIPPMETIVSGEDFGECVERVDY